MSVSRALIFFGISLGYAVFAADAPQQPLPYSHKTHAGELKLACRTCHTNPDPGDMMGIPPSSTCMECHASVKAGSPAIQQLASYAATRKPIPWVRVFQIPDYVNFSHRQHVSRGAVCQDCHGKVTEMVSMAREVNITMAFCMACHTSKAASTECLYCHDQQE